jgi:hypothetical protein
MKKAIFTGILVLIFAFGVQAQEKVITTIVDSTALAADTTNIGPMYLDYVWAIHVESWTLDATDATVTIQVANTTSGKWIDYSANSVLTLNAASGTWAFEDDRLAWLYMRVITGVGSVTSGDYRIRMTKIRRD